MTVLRLAWVDARSAAGGTVVFTLLAAYWMHVWLAHAACMAKLAEGWFF